MSRASVEAGPSSGGSQGQDEQLSTQNAGWLRGRALGPAIGSVPTRFLARLVTMVGMVVLTLGAGLIVGCDHPDAGSIDITAAKEAAAKKGLKMLDPATLKNRGRTTRSRT